MRKVPILTEYHTYEMGGQNFLFKVDNCNLFSLDKASMNVLSLFDTTRTEEEIIDIASSQYNMNRENVQEIVSELKEVKIVLDSAQTTDCHSKFQALEMPTNTPITSIALHIIHDCNLRCEYCYGDGGCYGQDREPMSEEVALQAVDFMLSQSSDIKAYSINFFGGEPLMNFELIKVVTEYCRKKEKELNIVIDLGLTTNGTLLNQEIMDYFDENNISVGVSIDGPKEIHDVYRKNVNGAGSYDSMMQGTSELLKRRDGKCTARITATRNNLNLFDITEEIAKIGFKKINIALVAAGESSPLGINQDDIPKVISEYKKIADKTFESIVKGEAYYTNLFYSLIAQIHGKQYMFYNCGAGRRYASVTPEGNMFLCHRYAEDEDYKIGDVFNGRTMDVEKFACNANVEARKGCAKCWARYLCGGGCFYFATEDGGNLQNAPEKYCKSFQALFEIAMELYWKLQCYDETIVDRLLQPVEEGGLRMSANV